MSEEQASIAAIESNAREFFPNGTATVERRESDGRWALLVTDELFAHRYTPCRVEVLSICKRDGCFSNQRDSDKQAQKLKPHF